MNLNQKSDNQLHFILPSTKEEVFESKTARLMLTNLTLDSSCKEKNSCLGFDRNKYSDVVPDYDDVTIILPYREKTGDKERKKNVGIVLRYLHKIGIKHVILSEEDSNSKSSWIKDEFSEMFETFTIVFTQSDDMFCKSAAINNAVKKCYTNNFVMYDLDVLIPKDIFDESLFLLQSYFDFIFPFDKMVKQIYDKKSFEKDYDFTKINSEVEFRRNADGGMLFCRKEPFLNIGGYNTDFIGWGREDNELVVRINMSKYNVFRIDSVLYHLWHDKENIDGSNLGILINYYNLSKFNDINLLINKNQDMYLNSKIYNKKKVVNSENYKISVIIPVYNTNFISLERCIDSIMNQSCAENLEIILIDDNSNRMETLDSLKFLEDKYSNLIFIYLDVKSYGIAENIGINLSKSDYITFVNPNNFFISNCFERILDDIEIENPDIIINNHIDLENKKGIMDDWTKFNIEKDRSIYYSYKYNEKIFTLPNILGTKVYKKDFLIRNNLLFNDKLIGYDYIFNLKTLTNAKTILLNNIPSVIYERKNLDEFNLKKDNVSQENYVKLIEEFVAECTSICDEKHIDKNEVILHLFNGIIKDFMFLKTKKDEFLEVFNDMNKLFTDNLDDYTFVKSDKYYDMQNAIANNDFKLAYELCLLNQN